MLGLAAKGDYEAFVHLLIEGYDHIIDINDTDGTSIVEVARKRGYHELSQFLDSIHQFEVN